MKKIMFNDRFGLTVAVRSGKKTQTRRIIPEKQLCDAIAYGGGDIELRNLALLLIAPYKVGEVEALKKEFEERNRCEHFCGHSRFTIYDEELARLIVGVYEVAIGSNDNE